MPSFVWQCYIHVRTRPRNQAVMGRQRFQPYARHPQRRLVMVGGGGSGYTYAVRPAQPRRIRMAYRQPKDDLPV